jgi:hypothetical protein
MSVSFWMGLMMGVCIGVLIAGALAVYEIFRERKLGDDALYREQIKHRTARVQALRRGWEIAHRAVEIEPTSVPGLTVLDWNDAKAELELAVEQMEKWS